MALSALSWVWRGSPFLHGMALVSHMGLHLKLTFMGGTVKRGVMGFGVLYFRNCQAKSSSYLEVLKVISIWGLLSKSLVSSSLPLRWLYKKPPLLLAVIQIFSASMTCCASKSCLLSAQPVSTSNAEAWKGVKLCLSLKYHLKKTPTLSWHHSTDADGGCYIFPASSNNARASLPLGLNHFQGLMTSLNITACSKWKPRHKALIYAKPDPRSCCALMCRCFLSMGST